MSAFSNFKLLNGRSTISKMEYSAPTHNQQQLTKILFVGLTITAIVGIVCFLTFIHIHG